MSTCVKIIFHEEGGGVDVRVGYDETPDATETELNYAIAFAQQLSVLVQDMACAQNLKKEEGGSAWQSIARFHGALRRVTIRPISLAR